MSFKCGQCNIEFDYQYQYFHSTIVKNELSHYTNKKTKKTCCRLTFFNFLGFRRDVCAEKFRSKVILLSHQKNVHNGSGMFPCNECSKIHSKKRYLKAHMRSHGSNSKVVEEKKI
ncbi:Zinc finger protein [Pseudolycoriella hygida]|uniref:Zinc finger protein n=1 Tax=Pseudolycoriella hygida TaxID=35572 RepID=A0A9Q0S9A3_9DIPT|nr:Zinc finger protein [Pseudolycoriella hygida]